MKKQPDITDATRTHILNAFWELYKKLKTNPSEESLKEGDALLSHLLMIHAEKIYYLTNVRSDSHFKDKLFYWLKTESREIINLPQDSLEYDYLFTLIFTVILTNSNYCYEHRNEYNPQEITALSHGILISFAETLFR